MLNSQKGFGGLLLIVGLVVIVAIAGFLYFFNPLKSNIPSDNYNLTSNKQISSNSNTRIVEVAKRTYYKNGQPASVIEERSSKNSDGSLETTISSGGKELSRQLFVKNNIFRLSNGVLTVQKARTQKGASSYLTNGESILKFVKQNPNLPKTSTTLNGKKISIYTIGGSKSTSFGLIKSVFAQSSDNEEVKVYVDESIDKIKKIEQLFPGSKQPEEIIDYTEENSPSLNSITNPESSRAAKVNLPPLTLNKDKPTEENSTPSSKSGVLNSELNQIVEQIKNAESTQSGKIVEGSQDPAAVIAIEKLKQTATSIKIVNVDPSIVPDDAIYLNPLSTTPTSTAYNSPIMVLTSMLFNKNELVDKEVKEKGVFTNADFISKNIKVRMDGIEVNNAEISWDPGLKDRPGTISLLIPKGLSSGYHAVEVFMTDSWYLAPNLLVTNPGENEKVLELELLVNPPPLASKLPNDQGYRVSLKGKNFVKPLQVSIDNTILEDSSVQVNGTEELILTIPSSIPRPLRAPAYDVTITKDGQKAFRPSFLLLDGSPLPPR